MKYKFGTQWLILFLIGVVLSALLHQLGNFRISSSSKPGYPTRIICTVPSFTEIVFALGEGRRVIAVSDFITYPPEALTKTQIGGYINPNLEQIIALQPDLILIQGKTEKLTAFCKQKNIPLLQMENDNLAMLYSAIRTIGVALGCPQKAQDLIIDLQQELESIRKLSESQTVKPKVFLCLSRITGSLAGFSTTGGGSFLSEILDIAGGSNIFSDLTSLYSPISKESLMKRMPDVIIEIRPDNSFSSNKNSLTLDLWKEMPYLPAVASERIFLVTEDYALIPGPRVKQIARKLYELIYAK